MKHIIPLFLCFVAIESMAQKGSVIKTFSTIDGLSINTINALQFDSKHYLWIGTSDGLQRYDGYEFKTFKHQENDSNSITANEVYSLYLDNEENLWITGHKSISIKRKNRFDFVNITKVFPENIYKLFYLVSEDETTVGIMQPSYGILYINKKTLLVDSIYKKNFDAFSISNDNSNTGASNVSMDNKFKESWIVLKDSLYHFHQKKVDVSAVKKKKNYGLFNIAKDSLLVITDSIFISHTNNPFIPVKTIAQNKISLNPFHIISHNNVGNNEVFISVSDNNVYVVNTAALNIKPYQPLPSIQKATGSAAVYSIAKDVYSNIWLGFNGRGGMVMVKKETDNFLNMPVTNKHMPYSVYKHSNGKIYSSGYREGVFIFNEKGEQLGKVDFSNILVKNSFSVRSIAQIDSNHLLFKFCEPQTFVYNTSTNSLTDLTSKLPYQFKSNKTTPYNFNVCTQEVNGEVFFNYDSLICSIKKIGNQFSIQQAYALPENAHWFCFNEKHHWIATKNAVYDFKKEKEKVIQFPEYVYIKQITEKKNDTLWIATTTGIYIVLNKAIIRKIDESNGLKNNFVYGILFDKNNNAWISTNSGLAVIYPDYSVTTFSKEQGLIGEEYNTGCFYKSPEGTMYFAGINGISSFNPEKILQPSKTAHVVLNSIEVNSKAWLPNIASESLSTIDLQHDENLIKLSFGINDFTSPQTNKFKIQLTYPDGKTSVLNKSNTVQFILEPGNYSVTVWAMSHEGYWSKEPLVLKLNIHPAWYQTLWFKILVPTCIILLALWLLYFILTRKQRKQIQQLLFAQQLQQEKERLSRDLHDNLGSQLTLLINNVNLLKPQESNTDYTVKEVKQNASSMLQSLRQTIWTMNHESITLLAFSDKLMEHAFKYIKAFPAMELNLERQQHEKENLLVPSNVVMQLFPIMQEALTNACKYSQASNITLGFTYGADNVAIFVMDDGKGFDLNSKNSDESFGLKNMKSRSEAIHSNLVIETAIGKGTLVTVQLPYSTINSNK